MYRTFLIVLMLLLLCTLFACAVGSNDRSGSSATGDTALDTGAGSSNVGHPMRLLLARSVANDSANVVTELAVDQVLRQVLDSIPQAKYLTLNYRDSLADQALTSGATGIDVAQLGQALNLDGIIYTQVVRFGSILAIDLRIIEPETKNVLYRDIAFGVIRYRDSSGTQLLGPAVYDVIRKSVGKFFAMPHSVKQPVATEAMIVASVTIPRDELGRVSKLRQEIASEGVKALGELARLHFPELVAFDYQGRNMVYRTVNIAAVEDYEPMSDKERRALFNIGIDRFVTASASAVGADSMRIRLEMRGVTMATQDSLIDVSEMVVPRLSFETTTTATDFVVRLIELAEPLYEREVGRIISRYEQVRAGGK